VQKSPVFSRELNPFGFATGFGKAGFRMQRKLEVKGNRMRNQVIAIALGGMLAIGVTSALYAQDTTGQPAQQTQGGPGRGHGMDPERQLEHMTKALSLSSDQQTQIKPILQDRDQKMQALWQNQSLSQADRHSQVQAIRQDSDTRIEAVLNDQQKQKFQEMQEHMGRRGGGAPGGDSATPPSSQPQ
jgi:periplasmic protein CpxP/Spy